MFGQTFDNPDLAVIGLLVILEGVLSIDNALVLGLLAKRLPKHLQGRALTYGLVGAFVFRVIAIGLAGYLLQWNIVKLIGGGYLIYVALKHFIFEREDESEHVEADEQGEPILVSDATGKQLTPEETDNEIEARTPAPATLIQGTRRHAANFWSTVIVIELTDIAFAIDSILAAIALVGSAPAGHVGPHPKLWVVVTGGMLGVILMRFAAVVFIKLLEKFPRFEVSAYLLVIVIGGKLVSDWGFNSPEHPHRVDFHSPSSPAFWIFWALMAVCFAIGFIPKKKADRAAFPTEANQPQA